MNEYLIDLACKSAINSELCQKHGSILICGEKIISGYNHYKYKQDSKINNKPKINNKLKNTKTSNTSNTSNTPNTPNTPNKPNIYNTPNKPNKPSKLNISIHAEEDAINNFILYCKKKKNNDLYIRRQLNKAVLIIIRVKNDKLQMSIPCTHCIELIKYYGIKKIIYSDYNIDNTNIDNTNIDNNIILIHKKTKDIKNRESSGYKWYTHI